MEFHSNEQYLDYLFKLYNSDHRAFLLEGVLYECQDEHLFPIDFIKRNKLNFTVLDILASVQVCKTFSPHYNNLTASTELYGHDLCALAAHYFNRIETSEGCKIENYHERLISIATAISKGCLYTRETAEPAPPMPLDLAKSIIDYFLEGKEFKLLQAVSSDEDSGVCHDEQLDSGLEQDIAPSADISGNRYSVLVDPPLNKEGSERMGHLKRELPGYKNVTQKTQKPLTPRSRRRAEFQQRRRQRREEASRENHKEINVVKESVERIKHAGCSLGLFALSFLNITLSGVILASENQIDRIKKSAKFRGRRYIYDNDILNLRTLKCDDKILITSAIGAERWGEKFWLMKDSLSDSEISVRRLEWHGNPRYKGEKKLDDLLKFG